MGFVVQIGMINQMLRNWLCFKTMPEPATKQQLKAYLGLLQCYRDRDMLPQLARTAYQPYATTSKNYVFMWTEKISKYFHLTKTN